MLDTTTKGHEHGISIHINDQHVFAPKECMTGTELRHLVTPPIGPDRDFYLEVPGPGLDLLIADNEEAHIKDGMHFYDAPKTVNPGGFHEAP